jgi:hypothetical protein
MAGLSLPRRNEMKRSCTAVFLILGLAPMGAAAFAQAAPRTPWESIEVGLTQLKDGDGKAARESFDKASRTDDSGLAELLRDLTEAYAAYSQGGAGARASLRKTEELLDAANRRFYQRHIPPALLGETLTRIRRLLKEAPVKESSPLGLRPLLCNLRLLSRDHATDGEHFLEASGKSSDMGSLTPPKPVFTPPPPFTEAAKEFRTGGVVVIELFMDSEGCPASEKLLKPLPYGLAEQTLAILRWWAFEPPRYEGHAVGWKLYQTVRFVVF